MRKDVACAGLLFARGIEVLILHVLEHGCRASVALRKPFTLGFAPLAGVVYLITLALAFVRIFERVFIVTNVTQTLNRGPFELNLDLHRLLCIVIFEVDQETPESEARHEHELSHGKIEGPGGWDGQCVTLLRAEGNLRRADRNHLIEGEEDENDAENVLQEEASPKDAS